MCCVASIVLHVLPAPIFGVDGVRVRRWFRVGKRSALFLPNSSEIEPSNASYGARDEWNGNERFVFGNDTKIDGSRILIQAMNDVSIF